MCLSFRVETGFPPHIPFDGTCLRYWDGQGSAKSGTGFLVFIHLSCYDRIRRLGGLNAQRLFLSVLEAGKSMIKARADSVSGRNLPPGSLVCHLAVFSHGGRGEGALSGLSFRRH